MASVTASSHVEAEARARLCMLELKIQILFHYAFYMPFGIHFSCVAIAGLGPAVTYITPHFEKK